MADVTGNLFTEFTDGIDYGVDFNASQFSYMKVGGDAAGNFTLLQNGNYTYQPTAGEVPAMGQPPNEVCCDLVFNKTVGCPCSDPATFCFTIEPDEDPCAGFFHCSFELQDSCVVSFNIRDEALMIASCIFGYTESAIYTFNSGSGENNFQGSNPTVQPDGQFTYTATTGESGGQAIFAITVTEGSCVSNFTVTINFLDFCANFFVNNLTLPAP